MKIYNEVVIDMNPESSSYGETLHEDSFEYDGNMMLMQGMEDDFDNEENKYSGKNILYSSGGWSKGSESAEGAMPYAGIYTYYNGKYYQFQEGAGATGPHGVYTAMQSDADIQMLKDRGLFPNSPNSLGTSSVEGMEGQTETDEEGVITPFDFTYGEGLDEFDPTKEEFRQYVETTGGFDALAEGYGLDADMFGEAYLDPLKFQEQEFGIQRKELGLQKEGFEFDSQALSENLRSATESYDIGRRRVGLQTGQSLFDIKRQVEGQQARGGFAGSGAVAATGKRAQKGVMADYNLQQRALASQMTGAKSAFDIGTGRLDLSRQGLGLLGERLDLGQKRFESEFWETEKEKFYTRANELDATIYE